MEVALGRRWLPGRCRGGLPARRTGVLRSAVQQHRLPSQQQQQPVQQKNQQQVIEEPKSTLPTVGPQRALPAAPPRPPPPALDRAGGLTERLLEDHLAGWSSLYQEYDYFVPAEAVYGTIPDDIRGTLFLIGPGLTELYGTSVRHPHDADGMVSSIAFGDGGQIFFRNRFVRTSSFAAEQALGRRVSRGITDRGAPPPAPEGPSGPVDPTNPLHLIGAATTALVKLGGGLTQRIVPVAAPSATGLNKLGGVGGDRLPKQWKGDLEDLAIGAAEAAQEAAARLGLRVDPNVLMGLPLLPPPSALFNPLDLSFRAPANANIVFWAGRLLAFSDGNALPYELHKLSLETVGPHDLGGALGGMGKLVGGYKIVSTPEGGRRLVVLSAAQSGPDVLLRWAELDERGGLAAPATTHRLPGAVAQGVSDFWVADDHYVVVQSPLGFNPQRFLTEATLGLTSFAECFEWDGGRASQVHLVPRPPAPPPPAPRPTSRSAALLAAARKDAASSNGNGNGNGNGKGSRAEPVVLDAPPLLPTSCVGCYSLAGGRVLVLDALCQEGLTGSVGGGLDSRAPEDHRSQPKPELTRIVVDLNTRKVTARVLSQRTAGAATTGAAAAAAAATAAAAAAAAAATPTAAESAADAAAAGGRGWGADAYHHVYVSASESDAAEGWAPAQALLKLKIPYDYGMPRAAAAAAGLPYPPAAAAGGAEMPPELQRLRGHAFEAWVPGDRMFLGPPTFIPRGFANTTPTSSAGGMTRAAAGSGRPEGAGSAGLPPLQTEVEEAAKGAAAAAAALRKEVEQDGWLLVPLVDAERGRVTLCVLDARDVAAGPVAAIALPHHLPHARAAHFTRTYCGPGQAAEPGWRPRVAAAAALPAAKSGTGNGSRSSNGNGSK